MTAMTGLLILTQPVKKIISSLPKVLSSAAQHVSKTLYVHLDPVSKLRPSYAALGATNYSKLISAVYGNSQSSNRDLDIRLLMAGLKDYHDFPINFSQKVDLVLFDNEVSDSLLNELEKRYKTILSSTDRVFLQLELGEEGESSDCEGKEETKVYDHVVLGGTFDRLHVGHKILLSEAVLRCRKRLVVGVTEENLLKNKTLDALIEPVEKRISATKEFLHDIDSSLVYEVVPIPDPMGPTKHDPDMELIVVSEETIKGATLINNYRVERSLKALDVHVISIVDDFSRESDAEELKVSSSSGRMRLLGSYLRDKIPQKPSSFPVIIGLTGGSASGKSSVAKRFTNLGAGTVDCDRLGHIAYQKGTNCYKKIITEFGEDVVGKDGEINRTVLGQKVFTNKEMLNKLNEIVWPEISKLAKEEVSRLHEQGKKIVILDAAILLRANWDQFCHQIWVCIINRTEAIKRIMERDNKTQIQAEQRIDSQMTNKELVSKADIVFCTQWEPEYTQQQVEKAWSTLTKILEEDTKSNL
ncbi:bifunctional Phosphopantetheine adenylyltransferase - Dephospho-CoA kinase [Oratosquilla oratoria]|uniref:bifunctional Phosphopantetheine adenylyltransferase - Dephospho-CoA kinase n=1 Tax=Oratosquilla oratoria TaxID=337810 RepID=UPI003F76E2CB